MIFKPVQLGQESLEREEMLQDRKECKRFGPCGVGRKALYLNSRYVDCRWYVPYGRITRVFKRVAMSKGGFSQKGVFASIPYLVVEYDGGKEKQCTFKHEEQVDQLLDCLKGQQPGIKLLSEQGEKRLAEKERARQAKKLPQLPEEAQSAVKTLKAAQDFLEERPSLAQELSQSAKRKRSFLRSKPSYRWVALAVTLLGVAALIYGIFSLVTKSGNFGLYFLLFGLAAIFTFAGASVLPTAKNNRKAILARADQAVADVERYIASYPKFPVPARYAHPNVLKWMVRAIEEGRAVTADEALEAVKAELKAINSSVEVDQDEFDEIMSIKPLFLNADYQ